MTKTEILSTLDSINKVFKKYLEDFEVAYQDDYLVLYENLFVCIYEQNSVTVCMYGYTDDRDAYASYRYSKPVSKGYRFDWILESLSKRIGSDTFAALKDAFRAAGLLAFRVPNMEC